MNAATTHVLPVPGASLYYELCGTGPILLLLPGGAGGANGLKGVADQLTDYYTVVTFERRGLLRSPLDVTADAPSIWTHADDVHRLLAALTTQPAFVAGTSFGAVIGLDLVSRHPEQIRTLIVHEAAVAGLLPEPGRTELRRLQHEVDETFRTEGMPAAMAKLFAVAGDGIGGDMEPDVVRPSPADLQRHGANMQFFLTYDAPSAHAYEPDVPALRAASAKIVPAAGRTNPHAFPHQCADALADLLGTHAVEFPGGHAGHVTHPKAFAAALREVLDGRHAIDAE